MSHIAESVQDSARIVEELGKHSESISAIDEITSAQNEQGAATHHVVESIGRVVAMAERNSAETGEIAQTAENLEMLAKRLQGAVNSFRG